MFRTKVVDKIKTHFMFNNFFPQNRAFYEKVGENIVEPDRPQMTVWRMRIACLITMPTNTHSVYVTLNAFPRLQRLWERAPMLHYTY